MKRTNLLQSFQLIDDNYFFQMDHQQLHSEQEKLKVKVVKTISTDVSLYPRSASVKRQWAVGFLANLTLLSAGMALGFPAISLSQLTSPMSKTMLTQSQASWFASINTITCKWVEGWLKMTLLLSCLSPPTPTLPPLFFSKRSSVPLTSIPHHQPGPLGGLLASVILDKLGRKFVIILINVLSIVAWSIQSWTDKEDAQTMFYQLLVARLIIG